MQKILLVEDNTDDIELAQMGFSRQQTSNEVELCIAESGEQALSLLEHGYALNETYSLIILDVKLPGVSGLDVLRKIKNSDRWRDIPVVMLTTSDEQQDIQQSILLGAEGYLQKPVSFHDFMALLRQIQRDYLPIER